MPTIVTSYSSGHLDGTYILPPVLYPDGEKIKTKNNPQKITNFFEGKFYLKLGHHDKFERIFHEKEEVEKWYRNGTGDKNSGKNKIKMILKTFRRRSRGCTRAF